MSTVLKKVLVCWLGAGVFGGGGIVREECIFRRWRVVRVSGGRRAGRGECSNGKVEPMRDASRTMQHCNCTNDVHCEVRMVIEELRSGL